MMLSAVKTHQDTSRSIVGVSQTLVINQGWLSLGTSNQSVACVSGDTLYVIYSH
jgi:thiamine phosphate synthase YjbQ (UPF0047 family)